MRHSTIPKGDSPENGIATTSNASSTCSQYPKQHQSTPPLIPPPSSQNQQQTKQQNGKKVFNIQRSRFNNSPLLLSSDSLTHHASQLSVKKPKTLCKMTPNQFSKQLLPPVRATPSPPQVLPPIAEKQSNFIKPGVPLPPIQTLSDSEEASAAVYTYTASTTSKLPHSTMIKRNSSLLPIILQSSSCIGSHTRRAPSKKNQSESEEEQEKNIEYYDEIDDDEDDDDNDNDDGNDMYYHLLDYTHLINGLPKPVVTIRSRHGQDDYGILFEQLDHIRETMPDANIYTEYARNA